MSAGPYAVGPALSEAKKWGETPRKESPRHKEATVVSVADGWSNYCASFLKKTGRLRLPSTRSRMSSSGILLHSARLAK